MLEMTNENFARLLRGLTIAVGNRRNRILLYQFLAAEIRALHCSYGVGDGESYKRALTFLENCERYTNSKASRPPGWDIPVTETGQGVPGNLVKRHLPGMA